jgi:Natural resistance-associated macrophage protein-like
MHVPRWAESHFLSHPPGEKFARTSLAQRAAYRRYDDYAFPIRRGESVTHGRLKISGGDLIAISSMIATAATLHAHGVTNVETSAQAAQALKPIAGPFAALIFTIGIIGTGLLGIPLLAGSPAYALAEGAAGRSDWRAGQKRRWRSIFSLAVATLLGIGLNFTPIDPIKALLERCHQRHRRRSGDGCPDGDDGAAQNHGRVHDRRLAARARLALDRGHGRKRRGMVAAWIA